MPSKTLSGAETTLARIRLGLILGALSALGPLAIDLYLPAFPAIAADLRATPGEVQRTLSVFFLALAGAQMPIGMFSDRFGRKAALYAGLSLFVLTSAAAAWASSISTLLCLRLLQGLGVCAGTVVSRAIIRDMSTGHQAAHLMAMSFLVIGIAPALAPLCGNLLLSVMSWRGLFLILALSGVLGLILVRWCLPESLPAQQRLARNTRMWPVIHDLATNRRFVTASLMAGLSMTVPYAFVTAAPFVFTGAFGLSTQHYALLLGANAICSIGAMQFSPLLMRRWGALRLIANASMLGLLLTLVLLGAYSLNRLSLPMFQGISMMLFALVGCMLAPAAVTALDAAKSGSGVAASVLGTLQLSVTAVASAAVSVLPSFSVAPLLAVLCSCFLGMQMLFRQLPESTPASAAQPVD